MSEDMKKKRKAWSMDNMKSAVTAVQNKEMGLLKASKIFGVPKITLRTYLTKDIDLSIPTKLGRKSIIPDWVEKKMVQYLLEMDRRYNGLSKKDMLRMAFEICEKHNIPHAFNKETQMAGEKWLNLFLKRHPELRLGTLKGKKQIAKLTAQERESQAKKQLFASVALKKEKCSEKVARNKGKKKLQKRKKVKNEISDSSSSDEDEEESQRKDKKQERLSNEWDSSDASAEKSSDDDESNPKWLPVQRLEGEFVIVKYDSKYFPGVIVAVVGDEGADVKCMERSGRLWKWPHKHNNMFYQWDEIVGHIEKPTQIELFKVQELEFQNAYTQ